MVIRRILRYGFDAFAVPMFLCALAATFLIGALVVASPDPTGGLSSADSDVTRAFQDFAPERMVPLMQIISWPGLSGVAFSMTLLAGFAFLLLRAYREAVFLVAGTFFAYGTTVALKNLVARPRPGVSGFASVFDPASGFSFPSGHVVHYIVFFGLLALFLYHLPKVPRALRAGGIVAAAILIATVGISRITLGAHWLTDVLAGYSLGGAFLIAYLWAFLHFRRAFHVAMQSVEK